ncbi:hypothetical protein DL93DRAFT_52231 [Clavulina sp. PMI_390]|nr:hypothetical protein DL93DRAFT_52231 [Clavulina sp. PMI_390]
MNSPSQQTNRSGPKGHLERRSIQQSGKNSCGCRSWAASRERGNSDGRSNRMQPEPGQSMSQPIADTKTVRVVSSARSVFIATLHAKLHHRPERPNSAIWSIGLEGIIMKGWMNEWSDMAVGGAHRTNLVISSIILHTLCIRGMNRIEGVLER